MTASSAMQIAGARRADAVEHDEEQRERGRGRDAVRDQRRERVARRHLQLTPARAPNSVTPIDAPSAVHVAAVSESVRGSDAIAHEHVRREHHDRSAHAAARQRS